MKAIDKKLKELFNIQSYHGSEFKIGLYILCELSKIKNVAVDYDEHGNIFATKGKAEIYTCVMCHIDTVFEVHALHRVTIEGDYIRAANKHTGVGGDDKCGVFACLELLRRCDTIKAYFFSGEEQGCIGSHAVDLVRFDDVGALIGIDRRGSGDVIQSYHGVPSVTPEFLAASMQVFKDYGYRETYGTVSDVFTIQSRLGDLCAINVSCGYHNPHSREEYVVISELMNCIDMIATLCAALDGVCWSWTPEPVRGSEGKVGLRSWSSFWEDWDEYEPMDDASLHNLAYIDRGDFMFECGRFFVREVYSGSESIGFELTNGNELYYKLSLDESFYDAGLDIDNLLYAM